MLNGASQKVEVSSTLITFPQVPERTLALSSPYRFFLIVFVCLVGFAVAVLAPTQRPAPQNVWQESTLHFGSETSAANLVLSPEIIMCRLGAWKCLGDTRESPYLHTNDLRLALTDMPRACVMRNELDWVFGINIIVELV